MKMAKDEHVKMEIVLKPGEGITSVVPQFHTAIIIRHFGLMMRAGSLAHLLQQF